MGEKLIPGIEYGINVNFNAEIDSSETINSYTWTRCLQESISHKESIPGVPISLKISGCGVNFKRR
jgi:hypothetical protein